MNDLQNEQITKSVILEKVMLSLKEMQDYTGFSRGYIYQLTAKRRIPYYKPNGKNIYFDKKELDDWLHSNKVRTTAELEVIADNYVKTGRAL